MEQIRTYEEACKLTAEWWADKSFDTPFNQNNGDDSATGGMAFILGNMLAVNAQKEVTPEKKQRFIEELTNILIGKKDHYNDCDVDYHPSSNLAKACEVAGVSEHCLPIKTFTRINKNNQIEGRYQYGGAWFTI